MTKLEQVAEWHEKRSRNIAFSPDDREAHAAAAATIRKAVGALKAATLLTRLVGQFRARQSPAVITALDAFAARAILNTNPEGTSDAE